MLTLYLRQSLILLSLLPFSLQSRELSLQEAIARGRSSSVAAAVARDNLRSAYWAWRTHRADLLPEVTLGATLPSYSRQYSSYQASDGSYTYVHTDNLAMSGSIGVRQSLWATGGELRLGTSLDCVKQIGGQRRFMSIPVSLTLSQPLFAANDARWSRRIEPLRYQEARAAFVTATEQVTMTTILHFFNLLQAREQAKTARQTLDNARRLHEVAVARRKMGQISENDLLQMQYSMLTAEANLTDRESEVSSSMSTLRSHLDMEEELEPVLPEAMPAMLLDYTAVLEKAMRHHAHALNLRRRQLEADYSVAQARGNLRSVTIHASVGLTATGQELGDAYRRLVDNRVIQVGATIPILDWGRRKGRVRMAESNREVLRSRLRQEAADFRQDLFVLVEKFNNQQRQLMLAVQADTIAQRRYLTNVQTFSMGRIPALDLGDSQASRDAAHQNYVSQLFLYWYYYYQLRSLTLWDWLSGTGIDADVEDVLGL